MVLLVLAVLATAMQRVVYEVRAVDDAALARLNGLKAAWPGTDLKECGKPESVAPTSPPPTQGAAKAPATATNSGTTDSAAALQPGAVAAAKR